MLLRLLLACSAAAVVAAKSHDTAYRFAQITDIHLEPFYNPDKGHRKGGVCRIDDAFNKSMCIPFRVEPEAESYPFGRLNCDPPMALLRSLMEDMTRVSHHAKPEFVIFTGDIPSHQLSCQYHQARTIQLVIETLTRELKDVAPKLYPVMGNNDYFPNYNVSLHPGSRWQRYVASLYARQGVLKGEQLETFSQGGYYVATPRPGLRLVVLNTVAWSQKVLNWTAVPKHHVHHHEEVVNAGAYDGHQSPLPDLDLEDWAWDMDAAGKKVFIPCDRRPRDPYGQFAWATKQLEEARAAGERVIIAGHVPPGNKVGDNNFCPDHLADLEGLSKEFGDIIEVQLYGDHSNDEFRMVWDNDTQPPKAASSVLVSAGVTPRKHCNPSWRMFDVSSKHDVHDFTQYYLLLTQTDIQWNMNKKWKQLHLAGKDESVSWRFWRKQYSFREQYGVGLDPWDLEALFDKMQWNPQLLKTYLRHMFSGTVGSNDYFDYLCDMRYLGAHDNEECAAKGRLLQPHGDGPDSGSMQPEDFAEDSELDLLAQFGGTVRRVALPVAAGTGLYVQVHWAALAGMAAVFSSLLATTVVLARRLRTLSLSGYIPLA